MSTDTDEDHLDQSSTEVPSADDRPIGSPSKKITVNFSEYPDEAEGSILLPCVICNRTFFPRALERHQKVCEKLQHKTRGVYESTKKRQEGFDIPLLGLHPPNENIPTKKKTKWREKRKEFLKLIRAAKNDQDGEGENERFIPSDYSQCPHCERHFGPRAIDRHVAWCQEQKSRLPRYMTNEDTEAIQRLKTRTKYTPPKPGHSEWKAPKKRDVVSSIPPASSAPNHIPVGRMMSPNPLTYRRPSPTPPQRGHYNDTSRQYSPPSPNPLTRKSSSASLPPGGQPRYYTGSLGRSSGRKFSDMLHSLAGCNTGYGVSSGYGSSSLYGSPTSRSPPASFNRSNSLRQQKRKPTGRMARHRDLASDMLASVALNGKTKREEPDGDEGSNTSPYDERYSRRGGTSQYDPFSAAELQFQDLLSPLDSLRRNKLGSTNSLKDIDYKNTFLDNVEKPREHQYRPRGALSLCSLGIDTLDLNSLDLNSPGESSEFESLDHSPIEQRSIVAETEEIINSFNPSRSRTPFDRTPSSRYYDNNLNFMGSPSRYNSNPLESSLKKNDYDSMAKRKLPEGANSYGRTSQRSNENKWNPLTYLSNKKNGDIETSTMKPRQTRGSSLPRLCPSSSLYSSGEGTKQTKTPASSKSQMSSFCYECGQKYSFYGAKFCSNCGVKRAVHYA